MDIIRLYWPLDSPCTSKKGNSSVIEAFCAYVQNIEHMYAHKNIYIINIDMRIYKKKTRILKAEIPEE